MQFYDQCVSLSMYIVQPPKAAAKPVVANKDPRRVGAKPLAGRKPKAATVANPLFPARPKSARIGGDIRVRTNM